MVGFTCDTAASTLSRKFPFSYDVHVMYNIDNLVELFETVKGSAGSAASALDQLYHISLNKPLSLVAKTSTL